MKLSVEEEQELRRLLARFPTTRAGEREFALALHTMTVAARGCVRFYLDLSGYALQRIERCAIEGAKAPDPGAVGAVIEWRLIRHLDSIVKLSLAEVSALKAVQHFVYAVRAEDYGTRADNVLDAIEHWQEAAANDAIEHQNLPENEAEARGRVFRLAAGFLAGHAETALVEALRG
jgi:hypothetical protein